MILVIAEKPSVAQTIAAALGAKKKQDGYIEGDKYIVSWCVGHLVQLADAAAYGEQYKKWSYDSLPILPQEWQYAVSADKGKQFATLKKLMHHADIYEVVNACDAGREGELIFRFVYEVAGCKKPMRRLWILILPLLWPQPLKLLLPRLKKPNPTQEPAPLNSVWPLNFEM